MKFPITPEYLEAAPQPIIDAVHGLENDILREICSRFRLTGELNEVAVNDIRILRSIGLDMDDIERCIAENTKSTIPQVEAALDRVVDMSRRYYDSLADKASITMPAHLVSAVDIAIIKAQTLDGYRNITRSLGFAVQSGSVRTFQPIAKAYQAALDKAELKVYSGSFTVQQAMEDAVRELADSGISIVDYASGHRDHADVAARRAIMTGLNQVTAKYSEAAAEVLETDLYEVTAHRGARDKGAGWQNHKSWQGKVYSTRSDSKYPNIYTVCGLGAVDGLEGANCRHRKYAFLEGVSERAYTDKELQEIDTPPITYEGRRYTAYEATQKQREIERTLRKLERRRIGYNAAGMVEREQETKARITRLQRKYRAFSKAAKLPEQWERAKIIE
ncbi:phage minor capsid protein [Agathobaculum sp. NSJ-28]|jgi:hypothetical protein|uniref:Phage minor capsid protein n=1 Tax=Agathobaculum faecis TaxID=2763013 RepID=A0A923LWV2_9FIRM|nr:phage minor capsid protein [Agathobaculum faecis]MBC5726654.1 phage minor capsid protein [Agathobaculum faecis]